MWIYCIHVHIQIYVRVRICIYIYIYTCTVLCISDSVQGIQVFIVVVKKLYIQSYLFIRIPSESVGPN